MSERIKVGQIYKITYPNGKIYIGQDRTDDINYFGSAHSETVARDFTRKRRRHFEICKDILLELRDTTVVELNRREREFIRRYDSANPEVGYNRNPRGRRHP